MPRHRDTETPGHRDPRPGQGSSGGTGPSRLGGPVEGDRDTGCRQGQCPFRDPVPVIPSRLSGDTTSPAAPVPDSTRPSTPSPGTASLRGHRAMSCPPSRRDSVPRDSRGEPPSSRRTPQGPSRAAGQKPAEEKAFARRSFSSPESSGESLRDPRGSGSGTRRAGRWGRHEGAKPCRSLP